MDQQTRYFLEKDNSTGASELEDIPIQEIQRIIEYPNVFRHLNFSFKEH